MEDIIFLEEIRNELIFKGLKKENPTSYLKLISIARAFNLYLEDAPSLKMCNILLRNFTEKNQFDEQDLVRWRRYGGEKAEFLIGLVISGREYINRKIKEQERTY